MSIDDGGHGALLSPLPPLRKGLISELVGDPAGFDRTQTNTEVSQIVTGFFERHLLTEPIR